MPDPKKLHSFLSRTQTWLQKAMDEGDEQSANYYEGLMDRGNSLAERFIAQQQQPPPQSPYVNPHQGQGPQQAGGTPNGYGTDGGAMDMGTMMNPWTPPDDMKRPVGRVMQYTPPNQQQYNPGMMYNTTPGGDTPTQGASPQTPPASMSGQQPAGGTGQPQLTPLYDLSKLNQPDKIEVDLNQEMQTPGTGQAPFYNPFAKPGTAPDPFKKKSLETAGAPFVAPRPSPTYADPSEVVGGFALTDLLPWRAMTPADEAELSKSSRNAKKFLTEPVRKWGEPDVENEIGDVPLDAATGKPVTWNEAQTKPGGDTSVAPVDPASEWRKNVLAFQPPGDAGEAEKMPSKYDIDPSFRDRIDSMSQYGLSADKQKANTAEFDRKAEFEKRVREEYGDKPSALLGIISLLLGGQRGIESFQNQKRAYQQGRAAVGAGMRAEDRGKTNEAYKMQKDKLDRDIQLQRIQAQFLPDAIKQSLSPIFKEIDKLSSELNTRVQNVGIDPSTDNRAIQIRAQLERLNAEAENITRANLPMVKRPSMDSNQ